MPDDITTALDIMHDCATESFRAAERFGRNSPQHLSLHAAYADAARHYESLCAAAKRPAYSTYDCD